MVLFFDILFKADNRSVLSLLRGWVVWLDTELLGVLTATDSGLVERESAGHGEPDLDSVCSVIIGILSSGLTGALSSRGTGNGSWLRKESKAIVLLSPAAILSWRDFSPSSLLQVTV